MYVSLPCIPLSYPTLSEALTLLKIRQWFPGPKSTLLSQMFPLMPVLDDSDKKYKEMKFSVCSRERWDQAVHSEVCFQVSFNVYLGLLYLQHCPYKLPLFSFMKDATNCLPEQSVLKFLFVSFRVRIGNFQRTHQSFKELHTCGTKVKLLIPSDINKL